MSLVFGLCFKVDYLLKPNWSDLVLVVVAGICICLASGFVENPPEASVIGHRYYGWPLVWRITKTLLPEEYRYFELFIDCLIWIVVALIVMLLAKKLMRKRKSGRINNRNQKQ
ncbi:MAG: hypothetical protein OEY22_06945 [Candidatus Bathyarchaeota archaeon]|nr:hypothetical protein [Candidatus Bathyarchaeota archaeon]MDH5787299.1 hypothetical protein [Candidatus Bathyarchaeota archaeon]